MKNKGLILLILLMSLIVLVGACFFVNNGIKQEGGFSSFFAGMGDTESKQDEKITFARLSSAIVTCDQESENTIDTKDVVFNVKFADSVSEEYVANTFRVEKIKSDSNDQDVEVEIIKENAKYYKLKVVNELEEDTIYNVIERTTNGTKRWAFQTEKDFRVKSSYPADGKWMRSDGTPELVFSGILDCDINDYVTIFPQVNGRWECDNYNEYRYIFKHASSPFKDNTTYTITVKEGLKDESGLVLKEDLSYSFSIITGSLNDVYLSGPNAIKVGDELLLNAIAYKEDYETQQVKVENSAIKIYDLKNRDNYIKVLNDFAENGSAKTYWNSDKYDEVYYQKDIIPNNKIDFKEQYNYYRAYDIKNNFDSSKKGFYLAIISLNGFYDMKPFQVANDVSTANFLSTGEFLALYKGENGNNVVDVYLNNNKMGTTDEDGLLYVPNYFNYASKDSDAFNYVEFKSEMPIISRTSDIYDSYRQGEFGGYEEGVNPKASVIRYNNGYLYTDRTLYKQGETVYVWGYARNRVTNVKEAKIVVGTYNKKYKEIPVELDEFGAFKTSFEIDSINLESYLDIELYIDNVSDYTRYIRVLDYSMKQYNIEYTPNGYNFINGETYEIKVNAETYDGIALSNVDVNYYTENYYNYIKNASGTVKTDDNGEALIQIPLITSRNDGKNYSNNINIRVTTDMADSEQGYFWAYVYPYKNTISEDYENTYYDSVTNQYHVSLLEHNVKDEKQIANDKIIVRAYANRYEKYVSSTYYDEYEKREVNRYATRSVREPQYDKEIKLDVKDGKASFTLKNWNNDIKTYFYSFDIVIVTDDGRELICNSISYVREKKTNGTQSGSVKPDLSNNVLYNISKSLPEENEKVNFGDRIEYELGIYTYDEDWNWVQQSIDDYSNYELYTFLVSGKGTEVIRNKKEKINFIYDEKMGANISLYTIIYDGHKIYCSNHASYFWGYSDYVQTSRQSSDLYVDSENYTVKVDVSFDKEQYGPGDDAFVTVTTTYKDKPIAASVNLSAVDTSYLDENGESYVSIISSLRNYYDFSIAEYSSHAYISPRLNEGGGGGGGGDGERDNLPTTAFFVTANTNGTDGKATIKVELPDNITDWTITTQAITNDFKAGYSEDNIKVSKEFYVAMNNQDKYIENEKFAIILKSFSKEFKGKNMMYNIEILDENENVIESEVINGTVTKLVSYKIKNGLPVGNYKARLTGSCEGRHDTLVKEFKVVKSLLNTIQREEIPANPGDEIKIESYEGNILILNTDLLSVIDELFELSSLRYMKNRYDSRIIGDEATEILYDLYDNTEYSFNRKLRYEYSTLYKLMENSNIDYDLLLRNLAIGSKKISTSESSSILKNLKSAKGEYAYLWAKANNGSRVLDKLKIYYNDIIAKISGAEEEVSLDYKMEDVLYITLGLVDSGSFDEAEQLYDIVKPQVTHDAGNNFELLVILSIKLNHQDKDGLYAEYLKLNKPPENRNYIKLYYVQNKVSKGFAKGELVLNINGKDKDIEVKNIGFSRLIISDKDKIIVKKKSDNLKIMLEDYKAVDVNGFTNKYIKSKRYGKENPNVGDIIDVYVTLDNVKLYNDDIIFGRVEDVIPNNMAYIENDSENCYMSTKNGQKLTFHFWNNYDPDYRNLDTETIIHYTVRITNEGEKLESGTALINDSNEIISLYK